jgi:multidrug efflux pump subunit AcrA (membrane-fusion protein)
MLRLEAQVPGSATLRPGVFARASLIVDPAAATLSVPASALTTFAGIEKVLVVEDETAVEKVVTTGRRQDGWVEIVSGVSAGETVVVDPAGVRSGQPVSTTSASRVSAPAPGHEAVPAVR